MITKDGPIVQDRALGTYPNSVYFKFKQSTLRLYLSNKLIIVGAKNGGK